MLRLLTAGESHGPALAAILEGMPAGVAVSQELLDRDLKRRQAGYGRGGRMRIERDRARLLSGVRFGLTLGTPIALVIENLDWPAWQEKMEPLGAPPAGLEEMRVPRPGHADLAGHYKFGFSDLRNVLERASARETAARVAAGALARALLAQFEVRVFSHVLSIGEATAKPQDLPWEEIEERAEASEVRCAEAAADKRMRAAIDAAKERGDSLGGTFQVVAPGAPPGLGTYAQWDRRLDGRLAQALMSIPAIKGVEIGEGFAGARASGSQVHDEIIQREGGGLARASNRAGGLEGGISNGEAIVLTAAMKPIPTLTQPLRSVDLGTGEAAPASKERSDVCAVPAAGAVAEAMVCLVLAEALTEKFGGDTLEEMRRAWRHYKEAIGRQTQQEAKDA